MGREIDTATVGISRGRAVVRGLAAGLGAGLAWWVVETVANWAFGGVVERDVAVLILLLDLGFGALGGVVLGILLGGIAEGRGANSVSLALGMAAVYGLIRVYEPPGLRAEALFAVVATGCTIVAVRVAGARRGILQFVHLTVITTAAVALCKAGVSEAQSTYFSHQEPSGAMLPLLLAVLPLAGVGADRLLGLAMRREGVRFGVEIAVAVLAGLVWGHPLSTAPLVGPRPVVAAPREGPDVILISMDTTRADHMSTYGYERETSPQLTAFAADGLNFTKARSPAQWTVPGHASMLTGMYPARHGAHYTGGWSAQPAIYGRRRVFPLAEDKVTLTELLRDRGYATGGFVANFANLYRGFGIAQGFEYYEDHPGLLLRPAPHVVRLVQRFTPSFCKKPFRSARAINAAALAWLDRAASDRPAFVFLNYLEPHHWVATPPFDVWARAVPHADRLSRKGLFTHALPAGLSEEERAYVTATYDGQILAMDAALGEFLQALKARGRYENAIIIVTADHGELLGEHDQVGHGGRMMYEGLLHIPLVVKLPGADRPRAVIGRQVQLVDIPPTVLRAIGAAVPQDMQGEDLQEVIRNSLAEEDINPEFTNPDFGNPQFVAKYGEAYNRAIRVIYDDSYKLITTSRGERLLFDLARDPEENDNMAERDAARTARMEEELEARFNAMDPKVAAAPAQGRAAVGLP